MSAPSPLASCDLLASMTADEWCCHRTVRHNADTCGGKGMRRCEGAAYGLFFRVEYAIDPSGSGGLGWAIDPYEVDQTAVFETATDLFPAGGVLTFTLEQNYGILHTIGRFRLSATTDARSNFADGLQSDGDVSATWVILEPTAFSSTSGATMTKQLDNSILLSGSTPDRATYSVTASTNLSGITGFRLEVIEDPSLPGNGPGRQPSNGDFVLTHFAVDAVAFAPDSDGIAYITNYSSNTVSVIDLATNTVIATVPVGGNPHGVAVTPDGTRVYVGNRSSNDVSVIDTATNTVSATVLVGFNPVAFGQFITRTLINNVNHPPVADAGVEQTVNEGSVVTLNGAASFDPDGDPLTYSWLQTVGPTVPLSDPAAVQPTFIAPFVGPAGVTCTFALTVSDGVASASQTVNVVVENSNHPPIANAGPDQTKAAW